VKKLKSTSVEAYVKGAPEVMIEICDKSTRRPLLSPIPSEYTDPLFPMQFSAG
jgi:cation-transporting ATPase 13A2